MDRRHRDRRILGRRDRGCHALIPIDQDQSLRRADAAFIVGASIFSATVFLLYLSSTVYHALPAGKAKRVVRILDLPAHRWHLRTVHARGASWRMGLDAFRGRLGARRDRGGSVAREGSDSGLLWLLAGGLSYTVGVVFYATDSRFHFGYLIWHLFVMAGTACHYFAVLWYAA